MGYGIKYLPFTLKFRKEIGKADDIIVKIMWEELKKERENRNKKTKRN